MQQGPSQHREQRVWNPRERFRVGEGSCDTIQLSRYTGYENRSYIHCGHRSAGAQGFLNRRETTDSKLIPIGALVSLKKRQTNYRNNLRLSVASQIKEVLLLDASREPNGVLDRKFTKPVTLVLTQRP